MAGSVLTCSVALVLAFTTVSAVKKINSIQRLKTVDFHQSVPKHSLLLLHWFANAVDIDNNDVILLTFDPNTEEYGSHHYGNYERVLNPLPRGYRYYTVGNLNRYHSSQLPAYVTRPPAGYAGRNMDRIIFRVRQQDAGWHSLPTIDEVYITQHFPASRSEGTRYDPDHTYQITTSLLREIREFSVGGTQTNSLAELRDHFGSDIDDSQLRALKVTWQELACLGLLLYIVIQEKYSSNQPNRSQRNSRKETKADFTVNIPEDIDICQIPDVGTLQADSVQLEVTTGRNGTARIVWRNVPPYDVQRGVIVALFNNSSERKAIWKQLIRDQESGSCDTSVLLNDGLQPRLHEKTTSCCFWTAMGEEIYRGEEFKSPERVPITGYDASLQLFVKNGKACARLFVNRSFRGWRWEFRSSWIGFYRSPRKATKEYEWWQWQWARKFKAAAHSDGSHDVYEYHSGMAIAPGVQLRFVVRDDIVQAQTPSWTCPVDAIHSEP